MYIHTHTCALRYKLNWQGGSFEICFRRAGDDNNITTNNNKTTTNNNFNSCIISISTIIIIMTLACDCYYW